MEDDRAAKAARAKALLAKRKAKTANGLGVGGSTTSATTSVAGSVKGHPSPPTSVANTHSRAPSEAGDIGPPPLSESVTGPVEPAPQRPPSFDPYHAIATRINTLSPLARTGSSPPAPPPVSSPPPASFSSPVTAVHPPPKANTAELERLKSLVQDQQQTISLLVSEKSALAASLDRLGGIEAREQQSSAQLEVSQRMARDLEVRAHDLQDELTKSGKRLEELVSWEQTMNERLKQTERDFDLCKQDAASARTKAAEYANRLRDLQEQIQADDRVEKLEALLKGVQDRADSLELQLTRVKQTLTQGNKEKETLQDKLNVSSNREKALQGQNQELATLQEEMKSTISALTAERDSHTTRIGMLTAQHSEATLALQSHQTSLTSQAVKLTDFAHRLQQAQSDAQAACRRADDAERSHKNLQNENVGLMASLNEMRPKLVELTEEKLNLTDRVGTLEAQKRELQAVVSKVEEERDEAHSRVEALTYEREKGESAKSSEVERLKREIEETKTHATQVEDELQGALASVRDLEAERGIHRQAVERYQHEMDRLDAELAALRVEMGALQGEAVEAQARHEQALSALEDTQVVLERANTEVESLRGDLVAREEEVAELREKLAAAPTTPEPPTKSGVRKGSLGQEILAVEAGIGLSAAKSRIRALEAEVFDEQARGHALQKRIQELEHELLARPKVLVPKNPTNGHPNQTYLPHSQPKGSSSASQHSHTPEKTNGHVHPATLPANTIDEGLAPEQRHKRRVSLHMLKARIEGELRPRAPRGFSSLEPTKEEDQWSETERPKAIPRRPQFMDENHVFWCSCCRGDLVVL